MKVQLAVRTVRTVGDSGDLKEVMFTGWEVSDDLDDKVVQSMLTGVFKAGDQSLRLALGEAERAERMVTATIRGDITGLASVTDMFARRERRSR